MHGVAPEQVVVTGAPVYDQWFARRPSTTREEFCRKVGLPPERPFFLYLCSSQFIAPNEAEFIDHVDPGGALGAGPARARRRAAHPPASRRTCSPGSGSISPSTATWCCGRAAAPTQSMPARSNDYFDSMYHAAAAVGRQHERADRGRASSAGRSTRSAAPEYAGTQEGTLHFHYLLHGRRRPAAHGADTLDDHAAALSPARSIRQPRTRRASAQFVQALRPAARPRRAGDAAPGRRHRGAGAAAEAGARARCRRRLYLVRLVLYPVGIAHEVRALLQPAGAQARAAAAAADRRATCFRSGWWPSRRSSSAGARPRSSPSSYIVPRVLPQMMTGDIADAGDGGDPQDPAAHLAQPEADRRRPVAERGRLRAALLDSVPQLGEDLPPVRRRAAGRRVARRRRPLVHEHHPPLHRPVRLLHAGAVPRQERRPAAREQAEAPGAHRLRPRDPEAVLPAARQRRKSTCCTRCTCTGCSTPTGRARCRSSLVDHVHLVRAAAAARRQRHRARAAGRTTSPCGSTSTSRFPTPRRTRSSSAACSTR